MRIVFVAAPITSRGGVYQFLVTACEQLAVLNHDVAVVYTSRLGELGFPCATSVHVPEARNVGGTLLRLRGAVASNAVFADDVAIVSVLPFADVTCGTLPRHTRRKWSAMIHGRPVPALGEQRLSRRMIWHMSLKWSLCRANRVIAVSNALKSELFRMRLTASCVVVHNGVDPLSRGVAEEGALAVTDASVRLGFVGRFSKEKGPDLFVEIIRELCKHLAVRGVMYGDGPMREALIEIASDLPVEFPGWVTQEQAFQNLDVLLITSRREGLGLTALEAGMRGIPFLAQAVGGLPEIVELDAELRQYCLHNEAVDDFASWCAQLIPLIESRMLREHLGASLRQTVYRNFHAGEQSRRLVEALLSKGRNQ